MPGHYEFIMAGHFFINSKLLKTANVSFNDKKAWNDFGDIILKTSYQQPIKIMKYLLLLFLSITFFVQNAPAQNTNSQKRYIRVPAGYLMVLRQGDDIFEQLETLAMKEKIKSANFTGMGFVNARFGFFNKETKEYDPREFSEVEMASMNGSVAWQKEKVSLHVHGVVTDKSFQAFGGHMLAATVSTGSVEIMITLHDKKLERLMEQPLGANVLNLGNK